MADLYLKDPKTGEVVVFDDADAQAAANAGYQPVDQATYDAARTSEGEGLTEGAAVQRGLLQAPEGYSQGQAFVGKALSGVSFGTLEQDPASIATAQRYQAEHPYASAGAELLGQLPAAVAGGVAGSAIRAGAAGAGLATRAGAVAVDYGINAAVGGAQIEGEASRLAAENFSFTDAAIAGVTTEVLGRGAAWTISKGVGGARNLITRAARDAVAVDAERSLTKGGWVGDYRVAQHAEAYSDELADLTARDLDVLETSTAEVGRQDKKRSRIMRSVIENPAAQHEINVQAIEGLQRLRGALADELADASGPAKRLAKQLDDRLAALEEAPKGRKLWKALDENRQALQEYRQDLYQAYDTNPGSAWLSREGLAAIDAAEEATRTALLREDAWGEAAARMQREYNVPFHEKWFPARQTVLKDLHFATGKDAQGFTTFRGEPAKMRKFLTGLGGTSPDTHRARELFTQYLDGAGAIAKAGERDAPKAAREAQEAVRRLRKAMANAEFITAAAERTKGRTALVDTAAGAGAAAVGAAAYGPAGLIAGPAMRGFHLAEWVGRAAKRLGLFQGDAVSMADLLRKGALPEARAAADELTERLTDDMLDASPFGVAPSARPAPPGGPIAGQAPRGVGVDVPRQEALPGPGPGQVGRQDTPRRPAGMEAITPQSVRGVGPEPEGGTVPDVGGSLPPRGGGGMPDIPKSALETFPTPYRTGATAHAERELAPGAGARAAEAGRLQALTEGEFAHVVDGLNATGTKAADGTPLGDFLAKHASDLKTAGLIVAGTGATAAAAYEGEEGVAGAAAVLPALLALGRTGSRIPGAWFSAAKPATQQAVHALEKLGFETSGPVANMLTKTFGERMPTAAQFKKMMPIEALEELGGAAKEQRLVKVGSDVHWYANGPETMVEPHDVRLPDGTMDHDPGGYPAEAWKMARTFTKEPNGDLIVHHDYFYLRQDLQGTGAGASILKDQMEAYRELGVKTVEVSCDDVGKYFWPSIGFDSADPRVVQKAVNAYQNYVVQNKLALPSAVAAEARAIKSLPHLANAEFGKDFLLAKRGDWNLHLEMQLDEANPRFHLMRHRLGMGEAAAVGGLALVGQIEGSAEKKDGAGQASAAAPLGFAGAASLFKTTRARLIADVAKRLFSPTVGRTVARLTARQVYTRAELARRQAEFQSWQENPQELVDRVAEGFRDVPPEQQGDVHAGVFRAATFLKSRLPSVTKLNAILMRDIPVSTEQLTKFARYEDATLRPRDAWADAAARGHVSTELLETTEELYPDLLAELRVGAYLTVREEGPPVTIQARLQYARLFDGDGSYADPSMSQTVANMAAMAYEAAVPPKPGGGPTSSGNVSHVAAASAAPAGLTRLG